MDINKKDKKGSTPLHWAAFSGAELALCYILAWDVNVNECDSRGFTPLHLAVKSSEDLRSTRSLRHLLIKGADRNIQTFDEGKKPIDIAQELRAPAMRDDITKLLQENQSFLTDCLMLRPPLKKLERSSKTMRIFFALMITIFLMVLLVVFPKIEKAFVRESLTALFILSLTFGYVCYHKDPGYLKRDDDYKFIDLLMTYDPSCLCPECEVIRTPRSRHCNVCKRCVDKFDHHCPWINNCIGVRTHGWFLLFITTQLLFIIGAVIVTGIYFFERVKEIKNQT